MLADGQWRSANETLRELLNEHLATVQLEIPGHLPPHDRELELARLACKALATKIVVVNLHAGDSVPVADGRQIIY